MAKETSIIFVYDTKYVQKEEDDPAKAILYFHPTWVSDQQKAALCGQIIGTFTCIKSILSKPNIISLQTGKFYILENGRFILAIGTDRNITDWLLEYRAKTLSSLVHFFHKDLETLATLYLGDSLSAKLYHIFETYLKMLMFTGNIFSHIPTLNLPKSASNVFMEAIHILECCQELDNVLGGAMMYHNKVVATQLSADLTKRLVLVDPYRIKCPAEVVDVSYELPLGVQLLQVYISNAEYCKLFEASSRNRNIFQYLSNKSTRKNFSKSSHHHQESHIVSAMKRDQSLLFTAVPEEGSDHTLGTSEQPFILASKKPRPKFLNLKSISVESNSDVKSTKAGPGTPFCGQRSVCSTPLSELKKFVHSNPLSICKTDEISEEKNSSSNSTDTDLNKEQSNVFSSCSKSHNEEALSKTEVIELDCVKSSNINDSIPKSFNFLHNSIPYLNITSNYHLKKKHSSLIDLTDIANSIPKDYFISLRTKKSFVDIASPTRKRKLVRCKSVSDPTFPLEKENGTVISRCCYNEFVTYDLEDVKSAVKQSSNSKRVGTGNCRETSSSIKKNNVIENKIEIKSINSLIERNKEHRKSLTLPLKPLTNDTIPVVAEVSTSRRYSMGVQLTPLLSKLSMLAFEERSSGFCSRDTTPYREYCGLTPTQTNLSFPFKLKPSKEPKNSKETDNGLQKCVLFVCGQQDVVLLMLLREEACEEPTVIKKMWEVCTEHLTKLHKQLIYCMESQSGANSHESEPYSFLCLNSEWDTIKRGGPWGTGDLGMLHYLHGDFSEVPNLTEILMRGNDNVIYAHHCGPTEVYYHESANPVAGLPPPADSMGLVQLKAKRRLERDHAVILL